MIYFGRERTPQDEYDNFIRAAQENTILYQIGEASLSLSEAAREIIRRGLEKILRRNN